MADVTGQTFNFLTAKKVVGRTPNGTPLWEFECVCGSIIVRQLGSVKSGATKSCKCKRSELIIVDKTQHGLSKTKEYHAWILMLDRCYNTDANGYERYGGRGIAVCPEWKDSFETFLKNMGLAPNPSHSVERKNNSLGYCPDNCQWATRKVQSNNRSNNIRITRNGRTLTLSQWSEELGLPYKTVYARIALGWSSEKALTTPVRPIKRRS